MVRLSWLAVRKSYRPCELQRLRFEMMSTSAERDARVSVPFLDLGPAHEGLRDEILAEIGELIDTGAFTNGPQVAEFEAAFASFCGTNHCVGLASGLDALRLALQACEIEPGDEVILPANTFIATAEAVTQAGGTPVLVDVSESDYNIDPEAAAAAIGPRTRFLLPVHLYGQLADMRALVDLAQRHGLGVVEDACQAHGASRDGIAAGASGDAAAFSFYPGKNLGAFGDAGALVTNTESVAERVRALREHGQRAKYQHEWIGWTSRLDTLQAIALLRKLPHLDRWNAERSAAAGMYAERLAGVGDLVLPNVADESVPAWHLFVVRTGDPESLGAFLRKRGIGSGRHYPEPIHLSAAYEALGLTAGAFPVSEAVARECLSLPIFPGITQEQLEAVCAAAEDYFARG
jgi:dTDP-4-amino-4,6-dideoxygalactose transaminase